MSSSILVIAHTPSYKLIGCSSILGVVHQLDNCELNFLCLTSISIHAFAHQNAGPSDKTFKSVSSNLMPAEL